MRLKFAIPMAIAAASLSLAVTTQAVVYTEGPGDAGDLPSTAQPVTGTAGTALTGINGSLTLTNNISDGDMYEILITGTTFTASDTAFVPGANNFDSQLFLFTSAGTGVAVNDDAASGGDQSSLSVGNLTPGLYYLLIDGSGRYASTAANGTPMFPNYTDGTTDPSGTYAPTSSTAVVGGYTGNSNSAGNYQIAITGAQFIPAAVPEPGAVAFVLAGASGLALALRSRRAAK